MGIKYLIIGLLLITACSSQPQIEIHKNFRYFIDNLSPKNKYSIIHSYNDSGFAGIDAKYEITNYTITGKNIISNSSIIETVNMEIQKEKLMQLEWMDESIIVNGGKCFLHEKQFFSIGIACFKENQLVYSEVSHYSGNHQSDKEIWRLSDFELKSYSCVRSDGFFCNIFKNALSTNPNACETLINLKDSCNKLKV